MPAKKSSTRTCCICKLSKSLSEYFTDKRRSYAHQWHKACKNCENSRNRQRYAANKDKRRISLQAYAKAHPEISKKASAKWRKKHPDKAREVARRHYLANIELRRELRNKRRSEAPWIHQKATRKWRLANRIKVNGYQRRWRAEHRESVQLTWRKGQLKRYGLTCEMYDAMLQSQSGQCAICRASKPGARVRYFHVDHDHATGKPRGLLCSKCNQGLGYFNDDVSLLRAAAIYLREHRCSKLSA